MAEQLQKKSIRSPLVLMVSTEFDPHVDILVKSFTERHLPFVRFNTEDYPLRASLTVSFSDSKHTEK